MAVPQTQAHVFHYTQQERLVAHQVARKAALAHAELIRVIGSRPPSAAEVALLARFKAIEAQAIERQAPTLHTPL